MRKLSGGERSRLLLAKILKAGGKFLILDEPTNDLDLPTLRVLEEALIAFPGVVCVVSHDRYFLNRVCTDIMAFEGDGRIRHSVGDYDYYLEKRPAAGAASAQGRRARPPGAQHPAQAGQIRSNRENCRSRSSGNWRAWRRRIQSVDSEIARIEGLFAQPDFHRTHGTETDQLVADVAAAKVKLSQLYARWEELEAIKVAAETKVGSRFPHLVTPPLPLPCGR